MACRKERRLPAYVLVLLVALPLATLGLGAYVALAPSGKAGNTPIALGSLNGGFHPVAGTFKPDATDLARCGDGDYICLEQGFGNIAYRVGPKAALALFTKRIGTDKGVNYDCHRIAHSIGSASFARFHGNVAKTFSLGSSVCASGYYHGVLERAFVGVTSKTGLVRVARRLCLAANIRTRSYLDYQCEHGLGHGLMIESGYDLPLALSVCHRLASGWDTVACKSGAFMENINTRYGFRSPWVKDDDPLYPCEQMRVRDRSSCYSRASGRSLDLDHHDYTATVKTCRQVDRPWRLSCFRGLGRDIAVDAGFVAKTILAHCSLAGTATGDCLYGAARTLGDTYAWNAVERVEALCGGAPRLLQNRCYAGFGIVLGLLNPTDQARARACVRVAGRHARACLRSAVAEVDPSGRWSWGG